MNESKDGRLAPDPLTAIEALAADVRTVERAIGKVICTEIKALAARNPGITISGIDVAFERIHSLGCPDDYVPGECRLRVELFR